jgi:hypothetical protein
MYNVLFALCSSVMKVETDVGSRNVLLHGPRYRDVGYVGPIGVSALPSPVIIAHGTLLSCMSSSLEVLEYKLMHLTAVVTLHRLTESVQAHHCGTVRRTQKSSRSIRTTTIKYHQIPKLDISRPSYNI